ncbi:hypothetical protein M569_13268, partial [Genlisea aurea]
MPTVRRPSSTEDSAVKSGSPRCASRKCRLRSERNDPDESPTRKSARLCNRGGLDIHHQVIWDSVVRLSFQSAPVIDYRMRRGMNSSGTSVKSPTRDPGQVDQLRAVKEALHVSTRPKEFFCREEEQDRILNFCKKSLREDKAGSLYVCGCPGTGKSLCIDKVKDALISWVEEENIQQPDILSLNCTLVTDTSEIFRKILRQNHCPEKKNQCKSLRLLQNLYSKKQVPEMKMILVIVDELDYLITKDRASLHDLFMLTTMPFARCILIGRISNAIDLADRFIPKLQVLNCKPVVVTFHAYSKDEIVEILRERLKALPYEAFQPQALELCAKKVAAVSGDMRKALSVCRTAVEMLEAERSSPPINCRDPKGDDDSTADTDNTYLQVTVEHVAAALSRTFKSPVVDTIQSLPLHQQIVLCSAVKLSRGGKKDATLEELNKCYKGVCESSMIPPVGISELSTMCGVLQDQGILKLKMNPRFEKLSRVALKVDGGDVAFALQAVRFFRSCLQ